MHVTCGWTWLAQKKIYIGLKWVSVISLVSSGLGPPLNHSKKIRRILMYQSKKSQRKYDVSMQGYIRIHRNRQDSYDN